MSRFLPEINLTLLAKALWICLILLMAKPVVMCQVKAFHWAYSNPESQGASSQHLEDLADDLRERDTKKLLIIKGDQIILNWFAKGWADTTRRHYSASLAKALVGGMSFLVALDESLVYPDMPACYLIDEWKEHPKKFAITLRHLATHTSGLEDAEISTMEQARMQRMGLHPHMDLKGWKGQFWRQDPDPFTVSRDSAKLLFPPGSHYNYSNPGIGMLTYAISAALGKTGYQDIRNLLWEEVYSPIGIEREEVSIGYGETFKVKGLDLVPSWGGGSFTANAAARLGRLMLNNGTWQGVSLIDSSWVAGVTQYDQTAIAANDSSLVSENSSIRSAANHYPASTMGWFSNFDGIWEHVPRDAYVGAGAGHQILLVIPSLDLIVVRFGGSLTNSNSGEGYWSAAERYLFNPIMDAINAPPYPWSKEIIHCDFVPETEIVRLAEGSDNWPCTWADDDQIYTAYGDGWGFPPKTEVKLSLGLAKIMGSPPHLEGQNIPSVTGERVGQGKHGAKASGLLFLDGTLYMLARNTGSAQLAWSNDYGQTWSWSEWRFGEGFGCPTFLNFGRDYADARDSFVYIYSQDHPTAYRVVDHMVLARVSKNSIKDWRSYEYFAGFGQKDGPKWSADVRQREPVFVNPGKCYRSGITYNKGLGKYLWCQIIPLAGDEEGPRFDGGLGIFASSQPWGPWETIFYTRKWDVGPGETASFPTKWISTDGRTCHLAFSGDDHLSIRKVRLSTK